MAASKYRASILLLAYNQEDYIRQAVECAFAQDADDIEIILSDDCSTDSTYEIMCEMAEAYNGPHTIRLNKNRKNRGVNDHINYLVKKAKSDVCVPFPADDTSVPNRVSRLLEVMDRDDALLVHSDATTVDGEGKPAPAIHRLALFYKTTDPLKAATSDSLFLGATSAYRRELWQKYGPLPSYSKAFEDLITGFRACLEGRISFIDEKLVCYRQDVGISNAQTVSRRYKMATMAEARERRQRTFGPRAHLFRQRLQDAKTFGLPDNHEIVKAIEAELSKVTMRESFYIMPLWRYLLKYGRPAIRVALSEWNYIMKRK